MQSTCEGHSASFAWNAVHKIINISSQTNTQSMKAPSPFTNVQPAPENGATELQVIDIL